MMSSNITHTIEILLSHLLETGSEIGLYEGSNRDGSGKTLKRGWLPTWDSDIDKEGFGLGYFGQKSIFGYGAEKWTTVTGADEKGFGFGYFGYGDFGYYSLFHYFVINYVTNGLHVYNAKIRDRAGNISSEITDDITVWICARPDDITNIDVDSFTGQQITISWS